MITPQTKWDIVDPLLGTMPDTWLAEKFDMGVTTIWERRMTLNVPKYGKQPTTKETWDLINPLLGTMTDTALADKFGASKSAVSAHRRARNIPAYVKPLLINKEELIRLADENMTAQQISKKMGASVTGVRTAARTYGIALMRVNGTMTKKWGPSTPDHITKEMKATRYISDLIAAWRVV